MYGGASGGGARFRVTALASQCVCLILEPPSAGRLYVLRDKAPSEEKQKVQAPRGSSMRRQQTPGDYCQTSRCCGCDCKEANPELSRLLIQLLEPH